MDQVRHALIAGMGKSGRACAQFLLERNWRVGVTDTRSKPPQALWWKNHLPEIAVYPDWGTLPLNHFDMIVASPGIPWDDPVLEQARHNGISVMGELELFARQIKGELIGITGTNGKSSVTVLLALMAKFSGAHFRAGGNLGRPAIDLLNVPRPDLYILELSSFQLESCWSLKPKVAVLLNITEDHLERHGDMHAYARIKTNFCRQAQHAIINQDDPWIRDAKMEGGRFIPFSAQTCLPQARASIVSHGGAPWIATDGKPLIELSKIGVNGMHQCSNVLAAVSAALIMGWPGSAICQALTLFKGLSHRMRSIATIEGVNYIDDSKATNPASTVAAMGQMDQPYVLIAGGASKNSDFMPLLEAANEKLTGVILMGQEAPRLENMFSHHSRLCIVRDMKEAVDQARRWTTPGEAVLLSPACASLDMFRSYAERGRIFTQHVKRITTPVLTKAECL